MAEGGVVMSIRYYSKNLTFEVKDKPQVMKCKPGARTSQSTSPSAVSVIQLKTLQFFRDYHDEHGYPPTGREVAQYLDRTLHAVHCQIRRLIPKGALMSSAGEYAGTGSAQSRSIQLTLFGRWLTTGKPSAPASPPRSLYLQTDHGFVGSVTQERKCPCGVSHFLSSETCYCCTEVVK